MLFHGSSRAACWLWMVVLLVPSGPAQGQIGRDLTAESRPGGRPEWTALGLGGGGAMYVPAISPADPRLMLLGCDMSGSYRSTDGGRNWEMIHYRQLSGTTEVRPTWHPTDPAVAFAVSGRSGPLKVTRDSGKTWSVLPGGPGEVSAIAIDPGRPELMLVGGDGNLHRSTDGGRTWKKVGGYRGHLLGFHLDQTSPAEARTCLAATDRGLVRSDDAGASWHEVAGGLPAGKMVAFAGGSRREGNLCFLYCSVEAGEANGSIEGGIFRSVDRGATWTRAIDPGIDLQVDRFDLRLMSSAAGVGSIPTEGKNLVIIAAVNNALHFRIFDGAGKLVVKTDETKLTTRLGPLEDVRKQLKGLWPPHELTGSEKDGVIAAVTSIVGHTQVDEEGGQGKRPAQYEFVLTTDVEPARVYAARGADGHVFRSDDQGATWREVLFQSPRSPRYNIGPNYRLDEAGGWSETISGFSVNPVDPDLVIATTWMDCFITRDGGKTWEAAHTRSAEEPGRRGKGVGSAHTGLVVTTVWNYYLDPFQPDRHYIAYTDIGYARSTDAGKSWYWQTGKPLRNTTYELAFDPETPGKIWAAFADLHDIPNYNVIVGRHYFPASGGVGLSTDFGVTWKDTSKGLPAKPITSVVVDPRSPKERRTLYASAFEAGVFKSTDGGQSWTKASEGLGALGVNVRACRIILHRDGTLFCLVTALRKDHKFVAEGPGLYRSADGGKSWEWINRSKPLLWPKDYDVDPRDSRVIYLGATDLAGGNEQGGLYKTTDGGKAWERIARKTYDCFGATVDPRRPDRVYMCINEGGDEPGLWLSRDAGRTWKALDGLPFRNAQRITFDPRDESIIYVSTFGGSVWLGPAEE